MTAMRTLKHPATATTLLRRALRGALARTGSQQLPELKLLLDRVEIDIEHLAAYSRICGFRLRDTLPATYLHNIAFPLLMELLTESSFPFPAVGLVHIANVIEQRRPVTLDERPTLKLGAGNLREHRAGRQFDIGVQARIGDELVWSETSTYLHRSGQTGAARKHDTSERPIPAAIWRLDKGLGRRFAAISGDINPIHLNPFLARVFGMPTVIAHGMYLYGRALAQIEPPAVPEFRFEGAFKRPAVLPTTVAFTSQRGGGDDDRIGYAVRGYRSGVPHLVGTLTVLDR